MTKHTLVLLAALGLGAAAMAEVLEVKSAQIAIRQKDSNLAKLEATAPRGAKLTVLERKGNYARVQYEVKPDDVKQGWVKLSELEPPKAEKPNVIASIFKDDNQSGAAQESAASKGVGSETLAYSQSANLDPKPLDRLVERRKRIIDSGELQAFVDEGKVGAK